MFLRSLWGDGAHTRKDCRGYYLPYRKFCRQDWTNFSIGFSPAPLSILGHSRNILRILHLDDLPGAPETRSQHYATITRSGDRIATTHKLRDTITITFGRLVIKLAGRCPREGCPFHRTGGSRLG